ncbi:hypothetical protein F4677DRAFT_443593 [Hypoxylon crocopeplum]|nr:hypothetical protein F4677DRAFT_443593 [Hypoxylon crocopeplum]
MSRDKPSSSSSSEQEVQLPTLPEHVTALWLAGVLGQKTSQPRPTKICVKDGFNSALVAAYADVLVPAYKREADFTRVAPTVTHVDMPTCYWAGSNATQDIVKMREARCGAGGS